MTRATAPQANATQPAAPFSGWMGSDVGFDRRWLICWLLFFVTTINYLDRQVFGILIPDLQEKMGISQLEYGRLVVAFQISYAVMMALAGRILDRIGARLGLAAAVFLWSIAEIGHVLARTTLGFGVARFFLGLGEAANFPACMKVIGDLFPARERATATGLMNSATAAGAIVAPIAVPLLAMRYGWQSAFLVTGLTGFAWLAAWIWLHRPRRLVMTPAAPLAEPLAGTHAVLRPPAISWRKLLGYRQLWAIAVARILLDPIWYFYLFWLPKFLAEEHGIRGTAAAPYLSAIFLCSGIGCILGGYCSSALIARGWSVNRARKTVMWTLAAIMSPALVILNFVGSLNVVVVIIAIAVGAHQAMSTHLYTLASDLFSSKVTGMVVGFASCLSALWSVVTAELTGRALESNPRSYMMLFAVAACLYPVAMILLQLLSPRLEPAQIADPDHRAQEKPSPVL